MGYDEKIFKAKANIKARRLWLVFAILLTANYGTDTANGAYSVSNYIIFVILCWLPFVCGDILLKRKGKDNDHYRLTFVIGYGIFYVFLLCTTTSPIAFTYILPIISLIVIFKDGYSVVNRFSKGRIRWSVLLSLISSKVCLVRSVCSITVSIHFLVKSKAL